ncbi:MAG: hypothetical protein ACOX1P_06030 [Thermoguttaceae bacterium]|jgi:hypothetical protein
MTIPQTRREFLHNVAAGAALAGLAGRHARAAGAPPKDQSVVPLDPAIEPLVRLLEETPRERIVDTFAAKVRQGESYENILAALLLAAVRNVEPRPSVGFKFHSVLVVQSIHLLSTSLPRADRWLPVFWALDYYKTTEEADERERGWTMKPVDEAAVSKIADAPRAFSDAMDRWNESAADAAIAALVRKAPPADIWEQFFRYGCRDFRSIGHKAIDVANTHRLLGVIGWRHAEPALRSLAYALLMHEDGNPADRDDPADRPWRRNQDLANEIPAGWQQGKPDRQATLELLRALREESENEAAGRTVALLKTGVAPQSIWDGLLLAAAELVVRQPGIVALHAATTTNALRYAYRHARDDRTRRLVLLQNAAFLAMFRQAMGARGQVGDFAIDELKPADRAPGADKPIEAIFAQVNRDSSEAARATLAYAEGGGPLKPWINQARRLVVRKGSSVHDYKFASAAFEDAGEISPQWAGRYLAAAAFLLQGSGKPDNPLIGQARAALARGNA